MQKPPIPINEASRIDSLFKLDVLDTPAEERFDRITRLAKRMFDVPIALISLVDKKRQWFKSRQGLDVEETSRNVSFCAHAIAKPISADHTLRIMEVPDTLLDNRFSDNPLVTDKPSIRFYAGFVLRSYNDYNLGTLCIIDTIPRQLSASEKQALFDFGMIAQNALQSLRHEDKDIYTALYNRRGFLSVAEFMLENCQRQKHEATLIYFHMLNYTELIKEYGELIEEEILSNFVTILKDTFRKSDLLARIGDDKFVALTSHHDHFKIEILLNRFKEKIINFNNLNQDKFQISYRAGIISSSPEYLKDSGRLLDLVDKRMYESHYSDSSSLML